MADQRSRLVMEILARVRGTAEVDRLGRAVDDVGDEMSGAARDAKTLDRAIEDVQNELRELNRELLRTGDVDALDKSRGLRSSLTTLQRMRRELGDVDVEAKRVGPSLAQGLAAVPGTLRGGLITGLVGGAVAAAPLLGGIISAAVLGSVGGAGIIGGVALAARDTRVQGAAQQLVKRLQQPLNEIGGDFVQPVIKGLDILGDQAEETLGDLRGDLKDLAPITTELARGLANMVAAAGPGISDALQGAQPVLRALADDLLPRTGAAFGDFLSTISGGSYEAASSIRTLTALLEGTLFVSGAVIRGLTEAYGAFVKITEVPVLEAFTAIGGLLVKAGDDGAAKMIHLGEEADNTALSLKEEGDAAVRAATSMSDAAAAAGSLSEAMRILNGNVLGVRAAENAFEEAIDQATQSLRDNGQTLNVNTEKGRANRAALDRIASSAIELADATFEASGSQKEATGVLNNGRQALIRAARQMGLNKDQARELANEILGIPKDWKTRFSTPGAAAAANAARNVQRRLDAIDRFVDVHIRVHGPDRGASVGSAKLPGLQTGGEVQGPSGPDRVLTRLTAGEFVVRREVAQRNLDLLRTLNSGRGVGNIKPMAAQVRAGDGVSQMPSEFVATARIDLGEGITKVVDIKLQRRDRALKQRVMQGSGRAR